MGLERQHQTPAWESAARSRQGGGHLDRMVAVVVHHRHASALRQRPVAVGLETPPHTFEFGQCLEQRGVGNIELHRHANRRQRVAHIVFARQVEHHLQIRQHHAIAPGHREMHLRANGAHLGGTDLRTLVKAVAGDRTTHLVDDGAYRRVVGAQNRGAIKRHAVQKIDKGFL